MCCVVLVKYPWCSQLQLCFTKYCNFDFLVHMQYQNCTALWAFLKSPILPKRSFKTFPSLKSPSWFVNSCQYCQYSFSCCWPPHSFRYFVMSAQAQRSRVIQLYKNLLYLGREYPQGYEYFRTRCHNAFMKNKDIQGEQVRWAATKKIFIILFLGGGMVSEGGLHHQRAGGSLHA